MEISVGVSQHRNSGAELGTCVSDYTHAVPVGGCEGTLLWDEESRPDASHSLTSPDATSCHWSESSVADLVHALSCRGCF